MNNSVIFGGILATSLLGLYVMSIYKAICIAIDCWGHTCPAEKLELGGYSFVLNLIGGLISAAVVGTLTVTKPNDLPAAQLFKPTSWVVYIPSIYILIWIGCGLAAVYFGILEYENVPPLNAQGKAWLGAAVAAVYAYFGVSPNKNSHPPNRKD